MKYALALIIKFVIHLAVLMMILGGFYGITFANILSISLLLTGISFIIGDLIILPSFDNTIAAVADFFLAFIGVWVLGYLLIIESINLGIASFVSAVFITIVEVFFTNIWYNISLQKNLWFFPHLPNSKRKYLKSLTRVITNRKRQKNYDFKLS